MRRRYRQIKTDGGYELVEIKDVRSPDWRSLTHVQRDVHFRSVVDGSIVRTHADLKAHNERNGVVHESEFGSAAERESFFKRKAAERADFYQGTAHTPYGKQLKRERIQHIIEAIDKHGR